MKVLHKCEHCSGFYEYKSRAIDCGKSHGIEEPIISKFIGEMKRQISKKGENNEIN